MAFYVDEEDVWKCSDHPSKRRRIGVCPLCLRHRLAMLCPACANLRPCSCPSSSTSSSSSLSRFFSDFNGDGSVERTSNLIDSEPAFRRSRSLSIPFLRSRSRFIGNENPESIIPASSSSFWSIFKLQKIKMGGGEESRTRGNNAESNESSTTTAAVIMRSRSVAAAKSRSETKGRVWPFPIPIKAFRPSRTSKVVVVHEN